MKIDNVATPSITVNTGAQPQSVQDAKARVTAKIQAMMDTTAAAQKAAAIQASSPIPPIDANAVSLENLSAISAPKGQLSEKTQESETSSTAEVASEEQKNTFEAPKAATEEPKLSSQYAQLARKERALRAQQQEIKAKEAALASREAALNKPAEPSIDTSKYISKDALLSNPWDILNQNGITYEKLTQEALNQPSGEALTLMNQIRTLEAKINTLEQGQEGVKKSYEENQKQSYQQAVNQIRNETTQLVRNSEAFEAIRATKSVDEVVDLIERTFNEEGILLSVEEAATEVENYLVEEATKLAQLKKIQSRLAPKQSPKQTAPKQSEPSKQPQKTLTNSMSAQKPLSARDRAILAAEGKLNK